VRASENSVKRNRLRLLFGILLCSLVFLFSISAKLAAYRHAPAANQIKSMKMSAKVVSSVVEATAQMPVLLTSALLLALIVVGVSCVSVVIRRDESLPTTDRWASPALAVRPPPSL
jgi:hypothetical protein